MSLSNKIEVSKILEAIKEMTMLELVDLVKKIENEFGVTAAAVMPQVISGNDANNGNNNIKDKEKTSFTIILKSAGSSKIPVIKEVRAITGCGLKDAKELVEAGNKPIKENINKEEADKLKKRLEDIGATVELQ